MTDPAPEPQTEPDEGTPEGEPETPTPAEGDEADQDEQAEDAEAEPEPPPPQSSFTVSEALNRKLETERKRHATAVKNLVDEYDQDAAPCPICETPDLAPRIIGTVTEMPYEAWQQLAAVGGNALDEPRREAEGVHMCDRCNGWGELDYPTRNPHMQSQTCPRCGGNGYLPDDAPEQPAAPVVNIPGYVPPTAPTPPIAGTPDNWGRPAGHPHWGQDPAAVGA
jgi:hypothetical protein